MDKLLRFFPHLLIFSLLIRVLIAGASFGEALIMLVFGAIYAGHVYLDHIKEPEVNQDIRDELKVLKETQEAIKGKISSITLGNGMRK